MSTPLYIHVTHTQHTHTRTHNTCLGHVYTSVCTYHTHIAHTYTHKQHRHLFKSLCIHFLRLCQREPLVDSLKFSRVGLAQILNRAKRALEKDGKRHADTLKACLVCHSWKKQVLSGHVFTNSCCAGLFCTFVYVRMYVSVCNFSELVCDLLPRRLFDGFC